MYIIYPKGLLIIVLLVVFTACGGSGGGKNPNLSVVDTIQPVIIINGDSIVNITTGDSYNDAGATASDKVDGNITVISSGNVDTTKVGIYTIVYTATDKSGNTATATRVVEISLPDNASPVISINGYTRAHIIVGDSYTDAGATASDKVDGNITVISSGDVDTTKVGSYIITYTAIDKSKNMATKTRIVEVRKKILVENLLSGKNPNVDGIEEFSGMKYHEYVEDESHSNDGSGAIKLVGHWYTKSFMTASFRLEKGEHYTLGAYMKALGSDQGQNVMFKIAGPGHQNEMNWNISKAGEWEEIVMPYRADVTGDYKISIFTFRYSLTRDKEYASEDGQNLDRSATILFDDFYVYKSDTILTNEPKTEKMPFNSSHIKIDKLGNWSIKENDKWRDFFPKFVYQDYAKDFAKQSQMYSSHGFTGYTNLYSVSQVHKAIDNGMKYNGIQVNDMNVSDSNDIIKKNILEVHQKIQSEELPATAVIMYEYDNEQKYLTNYGHKQLVSNWIDTNDKDSISNHRARPINMLNGVAEGVARNYKNSKDKNYIDIVSTYITQIGHAADQHLNPVSTLGMLQNTENQIAPVSIMQLQCHYKNVFIPSIFKGIGSGAKGLNFWRAGAGVPDTCEKKFEDNVWASSIKDVFNKIDTILPIIKEPLETSWSARVDNPILVSIGARDYDGKHYLILANFGATDREVTVSLDNLAATSVRDFFTQSELASIVDGNFSVSIGHHNSGFLVLELD